MQVRMHQFLHLLAGGTYATTVGFRPIWAEDILRVSQSQRQLSAPRWPQKELGVRDMIVPHTCDEPLLDGLLSYDVFELHSLSKFGVKNTNIPRWLAIITD